METQPGEPWRGRCHPRPSGRKLNCWTTFYLGRPTRGVLGRVLPTATYSPVSHASVNASCRSRTRAPLVTTGKPSRARGPGSGLACLMCLTKKQTNARWPRGGYVLHESSMCVFRPWAVSAAKSPEEEGVTFDRTSCVQRISSSRRGHTFVCNKIEMIPARTARNGGLTSNAARGIFLPAPRDTRQLDRFYRGLNPHVALLDVSETHTGTRIHGISDAG